MYIYRDHSNARHADAALCRYCTSQAKDEFPLGADELAFGLYTILLLPILYGV